MGCDERRPLEPDRAALKAAFDARRAAEKIRRELAAKVPPFNPDLDLYDDRNMEMGHKDKG